MAATGYGICLVISVLAIFLIASKNYENIDIYYWSIMLLNPVIILGYWLKARSFVPEASLVAVCFIYIDSTVFLTIVLFLMLRSMGIKPRIWIKMVAYSIAFSHLMMVWICVWNNYYYSNVTVLDTPYGYSTQMAGGPLKIIHYIYLIIIVLVFAGIVCMGYIQKSNNSRRMLNIYTGFVGCGVMIYFITMKYQLSFSLLPYLYTASSCLIVRDYDIIHSHDITSLISQHYDTSESRGYVAISFKNTFLGCNARCCGFMPFLQMQRIDEKLSEENEHARVLLQLIENFSAGRTSSSEFTSDNKTCICEIACFSVARGGKKQGYLIGIRDATEEKKNLAILTDYNNTLNQEVNDKMKHIQNIQRSIVLSMANMIENRDTNTGGHVKRTSVVMGILVDEVIRQGKIQLDEKMAEDIVRAAPMHDLGKLQIDSTILCKPGKLSEEEYEIMKTHSFKSKEMVQILLEDIEESDFVRVACNIARYHHERWDGRGYPEGLVGEMIPLEARIMAIADVYDALVSKRCYKEAMDFQQAYQLICENMGTQFDPNLKSVFCGCRLRIEEYYSQGH